MDEFEKDLSICLKKKSYCGYLDQNEFTQRYLLIKNRVNNSLTREELAFLLGRTPYFIIDYEELSLAAKLDLVDVDLLCLILIRDRFESLTLDKKDGQHDISHEKRMVRVTMHEYREKLVYQFNHRWNVNGENKPLKITEPIFQTSTLGDEPIKLINVEITKLLSEGYFNTKRSPLEIREVVWRAYKYKSSAWSIIFLKNIIYEFIRDNKLVMGYDKGHFTYQIKNNL
ncbi:hypothetical protein [Pedobacter cryoconitis]|uniref:Uncharacterized protein n=1 Tax=Pedobacter cryoconitis TaxID=188932 RepID=A0A327T1T3_9SPHI|nr:hypothetical protein [Pedobacter cryoconitis]RAJ31737.1 hypothetical protein LY11_02237 [Pedobacter cryoconitis]